MEGSETGCGRCPVKDFGVEVNCKREGAAASGPSHTLELACIVDFLYLLGQTHWISEML